MNMNSSYQQNTKPCIILRVYWSFTSIKKTPFYKSANLHIVYRASMFQERDVRSEVLLRDGLLIEQYWKDQIYMGVIVEWDLTLCRMNWILSESLFFAWIFGKNIVIFYIYIICDRKLNHGLFTGMISELVKYNWLLHRQFLIESYRKLFSVWLITIHVKLRVYQ